MKTVDKIELEAEKEAMRASEVEVIIIDEAAPTAVVSVPRGRPASRWMPRALGGAAAVFVHLMLVLPTVLGVAAHKKHQPTEDGPGSVAWVSHGTQYESMILLDLSAMNATSPDTPAPQIDSQGITPDQIKLALASFEPQAPPELKFDDVEEAETANEAAGDPSGNAALFGRYMGQVSARIERAWLRPRSAVEGGRFVCRVRVAQDRHGNVQSIELQDCGNDEAWRKSLTSAILRASPLSAPPEPWLFSSTLTLNFSGEQYVAKQTPEYDYEPVNTQLAMAATPARLFREPAEENARPAALDGQGDVNLTITGNEVRWEKKGSAVSPPR